MKKLNLVRIIILAVTLLLLPGMLCSQSHGAAGDVDLSFDPGSGVNGGVRAVVLQPAGEPVPRARLPFGTVFVLVVGALLAVLVGLWLDGIAAIGSGS